jgi:hypothetical protein
VLEALRSAATPLDAVAALAASMLRCAYGLESPPVGEALAPRHPRARSVMRLLGELRGLERAGGLALAEELVAALERAEVRRASAAEPGACAVLDLLRARTRRFEVVFVLGLEEGRLPRRGHESPFLADDARRELDERSRARLSRPDQVARDRYLFYTACTRATKRVYLAREAAGDDGSPRSPSPFWDEVVALFPPTTCSAGRGAAAVAADMAARGGADGARAAPRRCAARARRPSPAGGDRRGERLGAAPDPRAAGVRAADAPHASARPRGVERRRRST